ncbi:MAG: helix-turn-helix transcriptional regulator [Candidatus Helarchaeota archaeon]
MDRLIGMFIKTRRNKYKLTKVELGSMVNISRTSIANIESGKHKVAFETMLSLSRALNFNINEITRLYKGVKK